ncbi:MAG: PKD domain-containing protein [Candidatus Pacebacteria bacterium]|nr:PKD domain-containing protein [Candidatus Paceibacterota bacterium]
MFKFASVLLAVSVLIPGVVLAAVSVNNLTLNSGSSDVTLNVNDANAEVVIGVSANEGVKWNTLAICSQSDDVCSRSTAVKYFTQTSSFSATISKTWNGKRSSGESAPTGEYKVKATVKNEAGEETIETLTSPTLILESGEIIAETNDNENENNNNNDEEEEIIEEDNDNTPSSHSSAAGVTTSKGKTGWKIGAGRERVALVDTLLTFKVLQTGSTVGQYKWSFGDGTQVSGASASHRYLNPGTYEVVVAGKNGTEEAVARTKVTVVESKLALTWVGNSGDVMIKNDQKLEVNLGDFKLQTPSGGVFIFPTDTIIPAGGSMTLDSSLTGLRGAQTVALYSPMDGLLTHVDSLTEQYALLSQLQTELAVAQTKLQTLLAQQPKPAPVVLATDIKEETEVEEVPTTNTITLGAAANANPLERLFKFLRMR